MATGKTSRSTGSSPSSNGPSGKLGVAKHTRSRKRGPVERQYVAIDLHQRRSVIVRENEAGEELGVVRIDNDPVALSLAMAEAGPNPRWRSMPPTAGTGPSTSSKPRAPVCGW